MLIAKEVEEKFSLFLSYRDPDKIPLLKMLVALRRFLPWSAEPLEANVSFLVGKTVWTTTAFDGLKPNSFHDHFISRSGRASSGSFT